LRRRCLFWVNRLSFADVARLMQEQCGGAPILSEDSVWRWVQEEAARLDTEQQQRIAEYECRTGAEASEPQYQACTDQDLYASDAVEFVVMTDGIGVKAQKPTREPAGVPKRAKTHKRHDTGYPPSVGGAALAPS